MKTNVSAPVVAAIIIVLVVVAGLAIWKGGQPKSAYGDKPPGMPPDVAAEMQKRMSNANGTTAPAPGNANLPNMGGINGSVTAPGAR